MIQREFLKAGHLPSSIAALFYLDMSFMVWVMPGPLGVQIAGSLGPAVARRRTTWGAVGVSAARI